MKNNYLRMISKPLMDKIYLTNELNFNRSNSKENILKNDNNSKNLK